MTTKPILVVEDELEIRSLIQSMLAGAGFDVVAAKNGVTALHELRQRNGEFALVMTDIDMGRMNGMELAETVRAQYPAMPILFVSGLPVPPKDLEAIAPEATVVTKPFTAATLVEAIRNLIGN